MNYTHEDLVLAFDTWRNTPYTPMNRERQEKWFIYCAIRDNKPLDFYHEKHNNKFTFMKLKPNKQDNAAWNS